MDTQTKESQNSKNVFKTIIGLLGQQAEISDKYTGKHIVLNVTTEEPGRLIGRKGIALNSITHLMNLMLKRECPEHPHVIIDVHGIGEEKRERPPRKERSERAPRKDNRKDGRKDNRNEANEAPVADKASEPKANAPVAKTDAPETKKEAPVADKAPEVKSEAPAADKAPATEQKAPVAKQEEKPKAKPEQKLSRLQLECRNAAKEVKKWGDATYLPAMAEAECFKALDNFKNDKEIVATIDESRSNGDKKRVKLALKA